MNITIEDLKAPGIKHWWKTQFESNSFSTNTIFQSWEWNYYWWENIGSHNPAYRICILAVWEGHTITAIAPFVLYTRRIRSHTIVSKIFWLSNDYSDYPDILTNIESKKNVWNCLLEYFRNNHPDTILELWDIFESSSIAEMKFNPDEYSLSIKRGRMYLSIDLKDETTPTSNRLSKKLYKDLQYCERQLRTLGRFEYRVTYHTSLADLHTLAEFNKIKFGTKSFFNDTRNNLFFTSLIHDPHFSQKCFSSLLMLNGHTISIVMGFLHSKTMYYYLSGYDPSYHRHSPTKINLFYLLLDATRNQFDRFDFLRGDESYKYRWGAQERRSEHWTLVPNRVRAQFRLLEFVRRARRILSR